MREVNWVDLSPHWKKLEKIAKERDNQKRNFASSRYYNQNSHFVGVCGEQTISSLVGVKFNEELLIGGDGGLDFDGINVKGTTHWRDPDLVEYLTPKRKANHYILAGIDLNRKRGWCPGYVTKEEMFEAPIKDYGYGVRHSINWKNPVIKPEIWRLFPETEKNKLVTRLQEAKKAYQLNPGNKTIRECLDAAKALGKI